MIFKCITKFPVLLLLLSIPGSYPQRISARKCEEYMNLYRDEYEDPIFGTKDYGELGCPRFGVSGTIVGGIEVHPNEYPAMVSLMYSTGDGQTRSECGGTLISDQFVLTAAHCVANSRPVKVVLGEVNLAQSRYKPNRVDMGIAEIINHPEYRYPASYNDIALIKLERSITLRYKKRPAIRPACLPQSEPGSNEMLTATGWGRVSSYGDTAEKLMGVELPLVSRRECSDFYREASDFSRSFPGVPPHMRDDWLIPATNICAGQEGKDTCNGDSGGPLFSSPLSKMPCVRYIVGITSFGSSHCGIGIPGVFTNVYPYLSWIEENVWPRQ